MRITNGERYGKHNICWKHYTLVVVVVVIIYSRKHIFRNVTELLVEWGTIWQTKINNGEQLILYMLYYCNKY